MGQWHGVLVDGVLPVHRRANPSRTNEWWVPLAEKAYAKLNMSYDNIHWVRVSAIVFTEITQLCKHPKIGSRKVGINRLDWRCCRGIWLDMGAHQSNWC